MKPYKAIDIFTEAMDWLKTNYSDFNFVVERDLVWTLQKHMNQIIRTENLSYKIYNDYAVERNGRKSTLLDIIILNSMECIDLGVEFKFEPSKMRKDIAKGKMPVTSLRYIENDITRVKYFTEQGKIETGISIVVDEYSRYINRILTHENSQWISWGNYNQNYLNVSMLYTQFSNDEKQEQGK